MVVLICRLAWHTYAVYKQHDAMVVSTYERYEVVVTQWNGIPMGVRSNVYRAI